jgi:hypothetical protein
VRVPKLLLPLRNLALAQVTSIGGLMQLLMKERNGVAWTPEERTRLRAHLRALSSALPILGLFLLPGGKFLLPLLAWILDRRQRRRCGTAAPGT